LLSEAGHEAASLNNDHGCNTPHRNGAAAALRAKRSVGAAQRLDGDGPV